VFLPADVVAAVANLMLAGGRLQLSQTDEGIPRIINAQPSMSYVTFGSYLKELGVDDIALDLPALTFIDRARFRLNNIHADFGGTLAIRLRQNEVMLDVHLRAPDPAVRGERNGFAFELVTFNSMIATLRLSPSIKDGALHLNDPILELTGELSSSFGDRLLKEFEHRVLSEFTRKLTAQLRRPQVRTALERALTSIFLGGRANTGITSIAIDQRGVEVFFRE